MRWQERKQRKQPRRGCWHFAPGILNCAENEDCYRSKDALVLLVYEVGREAHPFSVWSLWENLKPWPTVLTSLLLGQYGKASVWDFPVTTSLLVIE